MTTSDTAAVSHTELVDRARKLQPLLAQHAGHGELNRQLSDEVVDALTDAGLFRLLTPRRFGGYAAALRTVVEVTETLATADGSAAWVVGLTANVAWGAQHGTEQLQHDVFGTTPDAKFAGGGEPVQARRVDGGVRFGGRWGYASGSPHAEWAALAVAVSDDDSEPPEVYFACVPSSELRVEDTWHTVGMRGTGSHTWAGEDIFVPDHRLMAVSSVVEPSPHQEDPIYRLPIGTLASIVLTGPLLGMGRAGLDYTIEKASVKPLHHTLIARQSDSVAVQMQIAEAALKLDTARLQVYGVADQLTEAAAHPATLDYPLRARTRAVVGYAARQVTEAIQLLLDVHGAGSFAESSPLQRIWRDANVAARHAGLNTAIGYEVLGKSLLDIPERVSPLV